MFSLRRNIDRKELQAWKSFYTAAQVKQFRFVWCELQFRLLDQWRLMADCTLPYD